jgi:hypothetical protein
MIRAVALRLNKTGMKLIDLIDTSSSTKSQFAFVLIRKNKDNKNETCHNLNLLIMINFDCREAPTILNPPPFHLTRNFTVILNTVDHT